MLLFDEKCHFNAFWKNVDEFQRITAQKKLKPQVVVHFFFRYYFKKVSDEFDCGVVFEEIREDGDVLPIFEDKIIGKVEKVD